MQSRNLVIIGIDGGATKVVAHKIEIHDHGYFQIGDGSSSRQYADYPGYDHAFVPIPLATQLQEMHSKFKPAKEELKQTDAFIYAFTDVLKDLLKDSNNADIIIGIGMPGLKTADKRGISALANGPRMPVFCDLLETRLEKEGIILARPVQRLGSDADYCGMGEEYAVEGLFRTAQNAYYLGGGTGVADAMKLGGILIPFDDVKSWIAKSWEFLSAEKKSLERYISARGMQLVYSERSGKSMEELDREQVFGLEILKRANRGELPALEAVEMINFHLAQLLFERISTVYFGWRGNFELINPAKTLDSKHPFSGTCLDRMIIGQRLGDLMAEPLGKQLMLDPVLHQLTERVQKEKDSTFCNHYMPNGQFDRRIIALSGLRAAPALGAGIDAYFQYKNQF